ncbi:hypothetical protein CEXT_733521 [Caerostris extrusa]|uniref:Uncharacterized protein n=1 Tax=Caerostris extrusa TaxID=172846 RepID=A0AAV4M709_CAEEX|nr:hypothetical protein CEXT_733521 [Caerostris extrusa]
MDTSNTFNQSFHCLLKGIIKNFPDMQILYMPSRNSNMCADNELTEETTEDTLSGEGSLCKDKHSVTIERTSSAVSENLSSALCVFQGGPSGGRKPGSRLCEESVSENLQQLIALEDSPLVPEKKLTKFASSVFNL